MLVINYKGKTPQQPFYSISVKGNNKSNKICFMFNAMQQDIDLRNTNPYLKVQNKEHSYIDKIKLEQGQMSYNDTILETIWEMTSKSTQYRNLELQLQFQSDDDDEIIWQTQIVEIELSDTINADEEIEEKYPSELQRLGKECQEIKEDISELKDGEVKRVEVSWNDEAQENELNVSLYNKDNELIGEGEATLPFNTKVDKTNSANKVYGTDENGNQALYDKDDFGQVEDVKVNNVSVVNNKVANIDLTPYAKLVGELPRFDVAGSTTLNAFVFDNLVGRKAICVKYNNISYIGFIIHNLTNISFYFVSLTQPKYYEGSNVNISTTFSSVFSSTYEKTFENTDNKTTSISQSSTDTQYPSAKAVYDLVQAIKRNAFTEVDTTTYPTLADFLASTGEEGYLYLYPVDTSDLTKGYKQYIWENSAWVYLGDTQLDLTNYPRKDQNETITGNWQFANAILSFLNSQASGNATYELEEDVYGQFVLSRTYNGNKVALFYINGTLITPATSNVSDIGSNNKRFKNIFIGSNLDIKTGAKIIVHDKNVSFGLVAPDTSSWTADKEIATTDQANVKANESIISDAYDNTKTYAVGDIVIYNNVLYKCITAITTAEDFDSTKWTATKVAELVADETIVSFTPPASNTLSQEQINTLLTKTCILNATWGSLPKGTLIIKGISYTSYYQALVLYENNIGQVEFFPSGSFNFRTGATKFSDGKLSLTYLNGMLLPNKPSSTGTFVPKYINGTLTWVQES